MALTHRVGWDAQFMRRSPWFWPLAAAAERFGAHADWPSRDDLNAMYRALAAHGADPASDEHSALRFADNVRKQDKHAAGRLQLDRLYDGRIAARHEVPTRERDWHDFFNALCFATFPRAKLALHRRQYSVLQERVPADAARLPPTRTPEQDALTLFDEGGAILAAEPDACRSLRAAGQHVRVDVLCSALERGSARVVPFGHALFEHLVEGLRCPGGFSLIMDVPHAAAPDAELLATVDLQLAQQLADRSCFQSPREGGHLHLDDLVKDRGPTPDVLRTI